MAVLMPGDKAGSWVVADAVSLGIPRTFRARHDSVSSEALLEVMPQSKATMEGQKREVDALQRLRHPSLPEVLDFGVDHAKELVWTAYKWFEGESLQDRLLREPVRWEEACAILYDLASALSHVHGEGFVHRDLRPANVIVGRERAWLTGFDFALTQDQLERLSQAPFGDLAYLAPEVLRDPTHHGAKADVYAFGCLAYELLTGKPAFPAAAWGERPDQAVRMLEWKGRTAALDPGEPCPEWLRSMVQKCSNPSPDKRLPDLDALVGWLEAARPSWVSRGVPAPVLEESEPEIETVTGEEPRPVPPVLRAAAPSFRPPLPPVPPRPAGPPPTPDSIQRSVDRFTPRGSADGRTPMGVQYLVAAGLGCLSALGFSALLILFVELSVGTL